MRFENIKNSTFVPVIPLMSPIKNPINITAGIICSSSGLIMEAN